ncbi:MAG: helix-turn-helix transcriptional regulator [Saprospiraceae bacterium]|uniref:Helix-turn-helix transcriptional regulator n=1 Tax=Candidatus Opimibacter skivensis TaxID=2982028 RepID=A0A9D7XP65_9BACT|nr:helix-turn-helix transcriptional regulator [Candidatus Opimibacter skivensis]
MAYSRQNLYSQQDQIASYFAKALSHSARLLLLSKLYLEGPSTAGNLAKLHPISVQAISQHLRILRKADLVISWEKFPNTFYKINKKNFNKMNRYLKAYLDQF